MWKHLWVRLTKSGEEQPKPLIGNMNRLFFHFLATTIVVFSFWACDSSPASQGKVENTGQVVPDDKLPVFRFEDSTYHFGKINEGDIVTHEFVFTNVGATDMLISNAIGSCGCTVGEWTKEPIKPGAKGKIKATFDSEGKQGEMHKSLTITANTKPNQVQVFLEGEVIPKKETE